jgi:NarL family two-component system response regulator LiaR
MTLNYWAKYRSVIIYGILLAALLLLLKWLEWRFIIVDYAFEIYAGFIAVIFTVLGIWLALKLSKPKTTTVYIEKEVLVKDNGEFVLNECELNRLGLSKRELEVLQLMAQGLSNQEIAGHLFVSLNTVKTHSSKLFEKMEVQRRTQAVDMAKKRSLIP